MKKITLVTALFCVWAISALASDGYEAPAAVKSKFALLYPGVTKVKWEKEDANYEAGFKLNKVEMSCLFDATGILLETEVHIEIYDLPSAVTTYVGKNYSGQKIKEAAKITDAQNVLTFEAEVKEGDLIFDAKGNFLRKVVENDKRVKRKNK